jgi:hypothetical protein
VVNGNVLIMGNGVDAIKPTIQKFIEQQEDAKRYLKKSSRMQSAALVVMLMGGNGSWFQMPVEEILASDRYCHIKNQFYPVGTLIKEPNGTYRECFLGEFEEPPYWGEESRPRSRAPRLT